MLNNWGQSQMPNVTEGRPAFGQGDPERQIRNQMGAGHNYISWNSDFLGDFVLETSRLGKNSGVWGHRPWGHIYVRGWKWPAPFLIGPCCLFCSQFSCVLAGLTPSRSGHFSQRKTVANRRTEQMKRDTRCDFLSRFVVNRIWRGWLWT